ncbi:Hypothetical protein A7982_06718 [Minicystis rosea]|nr:Hypothetical protein A7982_06718 [Minicystis rosea]
MTDRGCALPRKHAFPALALPLHDELANPRETRARVVFYSAAAWNNDVPGLVAALMPRACAS